MNSTRNGKIAKLPKPIREELNQRLEAGETGHSLVDWLNGLPEVRAVLEAHFPGTEIREQNLSEWRKGGYEDWLRHQEAMELAERLYEEAEETQAQGQDKPRPPMSKVLAHWLNVRFLLATRQIEAAEDAEGWRMLRQMGDGVARLRRAEQRDEQLQLERERLELKRQELELERERFEWEKEMAKKEAKRRRRRGGSRGDWGDEEEDEQPLTDEEQEARWRAIMGIPYVPPKAAPVAPVAP
jgi:hypothetical protein